jgi:hypothetical protein
MEFALEDFPNFLSSLKPLKLQINSISAVLNFLEGNNTVGSKY